MELASKKKKMDRKVVSEERGKKWCERQKLGWHLEKGGFCKVKEIVRISNWVVKLLVDAKYLQMPKDFNDIGVIMITELFLKLKF